MMSDRSNERSEVGTVTPYARIDALQDFYAGGGKASDNIIEAELKKKMGDEAEGQWVVEQFTSAAKTLLVYEFIMPLEKPGAKEIPVIPPIEEYLQAFMNLKANTMHGLEKEIQLKEEYVEMCQHELEAHMKRMSRRQSPRRSQSEEGDEDEDREQDLAVEATQDRKEYAKLFEKWEQQMKGLREKQQQLEDWLAQCRKDANCQFAADTDAKKRFNETMCALTKFLHDLVRKVPKAEEVVHIKREDGLDPFEENDMRQCLANLLARYRKNDELGVLTTVIQGMGEKQGNKDLATHVRHCEDFLKNLIRLEVHSLSAEDLVAIVAIAGMNEAHRTEFMKQMTIYNRATEQMHEAGADEDSTVQSNRPKKSLFAKVREFTRQEGDTSLINQKLRSKRENVSHSTNLETSVTSLQQMRQQLLEAQQAFAAIDNNQDSKSEPRGRRICHAFSRTGTCTFGGRCRFEHVRSECPKFKKGSCKYGDTCKFLHSNGPTKSEARVTAVSAKGTSSSTQRRGGTSDTKATLLFDVQADNWDQVEQESKCEKQWCVLVKPRAETVQSVKVQEPSMSYSIGWDTMASIHVATSLDVIPGAHEIHSGRKAQGLGGVKNITHQGFSPVFGVEMAYIDGGETPNLLSIGKAMQSDETGQTGVAIFSHKGAVRMRKNQEIEREITRIIDRADTLGLIDGTAQLVDGVYTQSFGHASNSIVPDEGNSTYAVTSMYASRVHFDTEYQVIGMLASAGVTQAALIAGVKNGSIKGLPESITEEQINKYFRGIGEDADMLTAKITTLPLRTPIDYNKMVTNTPGEIMYLDNIDPSFSRIKGSNIPTASVGGYRDAVLAVDGATGYAEIMGRVHKRDPHEVVRHFVRRWYAKWQTLKLVKSDKEFVTKISKQMCDTCTPIIRLSMAVPYDHRRGLDMGEGTGRWLQDIAQGHMNHARHWVKEGVITEVQFRSLWFHALKLAEVVSWMKPSLVQDGKTRFEAANRTPFNLSEIVILPFTTPIIMRKGESDCDGRGELGLYLGPSEAVVGGVLVISLETWRVTQKYSIAARDRVPTWFDIDVKHAAKKLYGDIIVHDKDIPEALEDSTSTETPQLEDPNEDECPSEDGITSEVIIPHTEDTDSPTKSSDTVSSLDSGSPTISADRESPTTREINLETTIQGITDAETIQSDSIEPNAVDPVNPGPSKTHRYLTRGKRVKVYAVADRPPKPATPINKRLAIKEPEWIKASEREQQKLIDEHVFLPCPIDSTGAYILPDQHIIIPLIDLLEYKWKQDPDTGEERWLECVRIVGNGARDDRQGEKTYAETPDRVVLLYMLSVGATLREVAKTGDAIRAYLNALSLDRNIVIKAPAHLKLLPRLSILNKGLYGTIKGALSFQVWVDEKFSAMGYHKCDVARGVYTKLCGDDMVRVYRHSDDFRVSSTSGSALDTEVTLIQHNIRTNGFEPESRFLGVTIERLDIETGREDPTGQVVVIRMEEKIHQMWDKYNYLVGVYNPRGRPRETPIPLNALREDLSESQSQRLNTAECKVYMELTGVIGWITAQVRIDGRFAYYVISMRTSKPRNWDMYLAIYCMEYLYNTRDLPLVLGGRVADPEVLCDASFAILPERRSVKAHVARTGPESGVIMGSCGAIKNCIKSVFEAELTATSDGIDTAMYLSHLGKDLQYAVQHSNSVATDSETALNWIEGCLPSKSSRHVEVRLYNARHMCAEGKVRLRHVGTMDNVADILTKPLPVKTFKTLRGMVLGHHLIRDFALRGVE